MLDLNYMLEVDEATAQKIADKQDNTYGEPEKITSQVKQVIDTLDPMATVPYEVMSPEQPWDRELKEINDKYQKSLKKIKHLEEQLDMKDKQVKLLQAKCREK
jgi:uncharacterized protein YukE